MMYKVYNYDGSILQHFTVNTYNKLSITQHHAKSNL